jgi:hypothetical protein
MKIYMPFLSFTAVTLTILFAQSFYFKSIINNYKKENAILVKKIELGYKKHLKILEEKELEKNAAIAGVQYSYSVNKPESPEYKDGYVEGYHRAMKDK